jgi:hypothetical protein
VLTREIIGRVIAVRIKARGICSPKAAGAAAPDRASVHREQTSVQRLCLARRTLPHSCGRCARHSFLHSSTTDRLCRIIPSPRSGRVGKGAPIQNSAPEKSRAPCPRGLSAWAKPVPGSERGSQLILRTPVRSTRAILPTLQQRRPDCSCAIRGHAVPRMTRRRAIRATT